MVRIKDIDRTSNSDEMKFIVNRPLTSGDCRSYTNREEANGDKLASLLLDVEHVQRVRYKNDEVAVKQDGQEPWSTLLKKLAPLIREATPANQKEEDLSPAEHENKTESLSGIDRKRIAQYLRQVIDPELGVNIVDLGLIYDIRCEEEAILVYFTATTPGCPMQHYLEQQIKRSVSQLNFDKEVRSELVWEPDWNIEMMSSDVKEYFATA